MTRDGDDGHAGPHLPVFTVRARLLRADYWHVTVDDLPASWTVAFQRSEVEARARSRIAIDLGIGPNAFAIVLVWPTDVAH